MYTVSSERLIGSHAIKYHRLVKLINDEYYGCNSNKISLFIDVCDILKDIPMLATEINPYSIASSLINLCAHYRYFFTKFYHTDTVIYLIDSILYPNSINNKYILDYYKRSYYGYSKESYNVIQMGLDLVKTITPYIEDIHYQLTQYEFGVMVKHIIDKEYEAGRIYPAIILSKDIYNYQMVSNDATMVKILRPYKRNEQDVSYMVTYNNVYQKLFDARKVKHVDEIDNISPELMSFVMAASKMPERGLKSICALSNVVKKLSSCITSGTILNGYNTDIYYMLDQLSHAGLKIKDKFAIEQRFKAVDIENQYITFNSISPIKFEGMVNLYDPEAVKEISMKYFKDYPLDLNVL